jgi:hypothetical protein
LTLVGVTEPDFPRTTRIAYDAFAADDAERVRDELPTKPRTEGHCFGEVVASAGPGGHCFGEVVASRRRRHAACSAHRQRGVHDAHEDPGEPDCRIGEVSPIIGKVPGTPGT